jgi:hypothetical protein
MQKITIQLVIGIIVLCTPFSVLAKAKTYEGVVMHFVYEDENRFKDMAISPLAAGTELKATFSFKLRTSEGNFIDLDDSIDWSKYANRMVSFTASEAVDALGSKLLKANQKSFRVLDSPIIEYSSAIPPTTQGVFKNLAVIIAVQEPTAPPVNTSFISFSQVLAPMFHNQRSARDFFFEASSGLLLFRGLVNPTQGDAAAVTINTEISNCNQQKTQEWPALIDQKLRLQGIEPNAYNSTVFVFDDIPGCATISIASSGVLGVLGRREYIYTNRETLLSEFANEAIAHEAGHQLGLNHSNGYTCSDPANIPASCIVTEYGDRSCFMGSKYMMPNVYQRRRLGWYDMAFKELIFNGQYNVFSPSIPGGSGTKRLMSCKFCHAPLTGSAAGYSLYIEARQNYQLYDNYYQDGALLLPYMKGVKLLIGLEDITIFYAQPFIIDTTPGDNRTHNAPLILQSYTLGGVRIDHTQVTSPRTGSKINFTRLN